MGDAIGLNPSKFFRQIEFFQGILTELLAIQKWNNIYNNNKKALDIAVWSSIYVVLATVEN